MKISNIKINAYGNLENKDIELKDGLNIVCGKNESGKSTLLSYITSTFYGISKLKDGKTISDYEKYKPWNNEEFSGRIGYELDNGEKYEVFRDFNKKNPNIYNSNLEDISKEFNIDKKEGNQFFVEQTGIDKQMYLSTVVSMQQEVRLDEKSQNILIQKIANLASTGEDSISYKKAIGKLQDKLRDEVGNTKTAQKPINVVMQELTEIKKQLEKSEPYKNKKYELENVKEKILKDINENEVKKCLYEELLELDNNQKENIQKINLSNSNKDENIRKLNELHKEERIYEESKNELEKKIQDIKNKNEEEQLKIRNIENIRQDIENEETIKEQEVPKPRFSNMAFGIASIILIGLVIIFFSTKNYIYAGIFTIIEIILAIVFTVLRLKYSKESNRRKLEQAQKKKSLELKKEEIEKQKNEILDKIKEIETELESFMVQKNELIQKQSMIRGQEILLEKNNQSIINDINEMESKINEGLRAQKEILRKKYENKIEEYNLDQIINSTEVKQDNIKVGELINELKLKLRGLEIEENTIIPQLDNIVSLKEKEQFYNEEYENLKKKAEIINIAIENLGQAYEEMKTSITPKFTQNLSSSIEKITSSKYTKVTINDEKGMIVENSRGEYIEAGKLSTGTIDQLYLSLRLSMINDLSKESLPIILDETFAYFDESRLEKALRFIADNLKNHQAIIFTCTNREKEALDKMNAQYNLVEL